MKNAYPLVRPRWLNLASFARRADLHPDLVLRFVALGLLDPYRDAGGDLWFPETELATAARVRDLRAKLSLNYAAIGMVLELLDRMDTVRATARAAPRPHRR